MKQHNVLYMLWLYILYLHLHVMDVCLLHCIQYFCILYLSHTVHDTITCGNHTTLICWDVILQQYRWLPGIRRDTKRSVYIKGFHKPVFLK